MDSLQKEKEELILALQSAKKDTNQAKYDHFKFLAVVLLVPVIIFMQFQVMKLICFDIKVK